jgi:uncharacterized membrane protein
VAKIYRLFIKGLFAVLPILITVNLVLWLTGFAEDIFAEPLQQFLPKALYIKGMGVLLGFGIIILVGAMVNNYLTSQFLNWMQGYLQKIPFIKTIYNPIRDILNLFDGESSSGLQRVVLVNFPALNGAAGGNQGEESIEMLGLVTRDRFNDLEISGLDGSRIAVYIPFSYAMGGYTIIVPKSRVRETKINAQEALKLAITGWVKAKNQE